MKVLMINGSPNAKGCTWTALNETARILKEDGIESEIVQAGHLEIRGCMDCRKCMEIGKCAIDDLVNETAQKLAASEGLIVGSPVHYASPAGAVISFLDRLFFSTRGIDKRMKPGAAIVSARRAGTTAAYDVLNKYFTISGMPVVPSQYWNMVHGNTPEEVRQDLEGMQIMRTLGHNMAFLIKSIALGKERYGLPVKEKDQAITNFIR